LPNWHAARHSLGFFMCVCALLSPSAHAQTAPSIQEAETGIIVTRTSDQAQSVLRELKAGMDFGVLAKEMSIDPTANDGGYIGRMNLADLPPALRDALLNLHGEKFSAIVPVPAGFAILTIFPTGSSIRPWRAPSAKSPSRMRSSAPKRFLRLKKPAPTRRLPMS
jgi:hypothetical protein